jgi:capsular polysaccharide biosynthesis protein
VIAERFNAEHPEYAEYGITSSSIGRLCSVSVPTNTKLIEVDVKTTDPNLSTDIANTFAKYAPSEIVRITKAGGVEIVDWAIVPKSPSSPNLTRNALIGVLAGVVLAAAFFVLRALLDTTIYTSEEVHKVSQCPVIGTVPMIIVGSEEITPWQVALREEITNG